MFGAGDDKSGKLQQAEIYLLLERSFHDAIALFLPQKLCVLRCHAACQLWQCQCESSVH